MARIKYDSNTTGGAVAWGVVNGILTSGYTLTRLKRQMDSMIGAGLDYTKLEQPFGLTPGTGNTFYNTISNLLTAVNTAGGPLNDLDKLASDPSGG